MDDDTRISTQSDLEAAWRSMMEPLGFGGRSVWMLMIQPDGRPLRQITHIEECDQAPDREGLAGLTQILSQLSSDLEPGTRFAFLYSRPGAGGLTEEDRSWAQGLYEAAARAQVPMEVVHRAHDRDLVPVPYDEVLPTSAA